MMFWSFRVYKKNSILKSGSFKIATGKLEQKLIELNEDYDISEIKDLKLNMVE